MNAFEDVVKLFLEENNYWVRQSFKVTTITKEDKRNIGKHSLPTPEIDMIALNLDRNELLLVEAKSFLDSHGIYLEALQNNTDRGAIEIFTNRVYRNIITTRTKEALISKNLINSSTQIKYALAAGHIHAYKEWDEEKRIKNYFAQQGWILFSPSEIKNTIKRLADKGYVDNLIVVTTKIVNRE